MMFWHGLSISWFDGLDIALVSMVVYFVFRLLRGTRAVQMAMGLAVVVALYEVSHMFGLLTLEWLFGQFFSVFIVVLVVLFQQEIRRALVKVGGNTLLKSESPSYVQPLAQACIELSKRSWGGLIVIERETGLGHLDESGLRLDADVTTDLLVTLFCPMSPTHDGAVIIRHGHIRVCRVLLPLSDSLDIRSRFGTRHRAAMGASEDSDAIVIVVSEERGDIRLVQGGHLGEPQRQDSLAAELSRALVLKA